MQVASSASATRVNPRTLMQERAIVFTFESGHTLEWFKDGRRYYRRPASVGRGTPGLSPRTAPKICAEMDRAAEEFSRR